jgi:hypothetical protein
MTACLAYWAGICLLIGAIIYALLCTADDTTDEIAHGDCPHLPDGLRVSRNHSERNRT